MAVDPERPPPLTVIPTAYWRARTVALMLMSIAAVIASTVAGLNALDSHQGRETISDELDAQRRQNDDLSRQLDCRYVLGADRDRLESEIFVTVALALSAAGRRETAAVQLYTVHLDSLAGQLDEANERRADAVAICETEPENVLG